MVEINSSFIKLFIIFPTGCDLSFMHSFVNKALNLECFLNETQIFILLRKFKDKKLRLR